MKRLAIIDSGYDKHGEFFSQIKRVNIHYSKNKIVIDSIDNGDYIGHGTAIVNRILKKTSSHVDVIMISIFTDAMNADENLLNEALRYCSETIAPDVVLMSLGIRKLSSLMHENICKLTSLGTVVVSAFDNEKCLSFPAGFAEVIGVDVSKKYTQEMKFDVYDADGVVDVVGADIHYRLDWLNGKKVFFEGSSFFASDVVTILLDERARLKNKKDAMNVLKRKATKVFTEHTNALNWVQTFISEIRKAIIFPVNKEIFPMAANEELCRFSIVKYCDVKYSMNVGKSISEVKAYTCNKKIIYDIEELDWENEEFDTFICGHVKEVTDITGKDYLGEIVKKCKKYNKRLFSFDRIKINRNKKFVFGKNYYYPYNIYNKCLEYRNGKMLINNLPTILIVGTSSKQGKFTIQLKIMDYLRKNGINVGAIGSEPTSLLMRFDECLAYGYNNNFFVDSERVPLIVNDYIRKFHECGKEIVMLGEQSGVIPFNMVNNKMYTLNQLAVIIGLSPDSFILCANEGDDYDYVIRSIDFVKSVTGAKLLCVVKSGILKHALGCVKRWEGIEGIDVFDVEDKFIGDKLGKIIVNYYKKQ